MQLHLCTYKCTSVQSVNVDCVQVVVQNGGAVVEQYDRELCTHLLALHRRSEAFEQVGALPCGVELSASASHNGKLNALKYNS